MASKQFSRLDGLWIALRLCDGASSTRNGAIASGVRRLADKCCFQVIYFVSSIFFSPPAKRGPAARVETIRLMPATNNA
jgi:hypothetical protein